MREGFQFALESEDWIISVLTLEMDRPGEGKALWIKKVGPKVCQCV